MSKLTDGTVRPSRRVSGASKTNEASISSDIGGLAGKLSNRKYSSLYLK